MTRQQLRNLRRRIARGCHWLDGQLCRRPAEAIRPHPRFVRLQADLALLLADEKAAHGWRTEGV